MKQIYLPICLFFGLLFTILQGCSREPKPQVMSEISSASTTNIVTDNTVASNEAIATQTPVLANSEQSATIPTDAPSADIQTNSTQPELIKESTKLNEIANKVLASKKEKQASADKKVKQAAAPTQEKLNDIDKQLLAEAQKSKEALQKPTEMSMIPSEQPERATASVAAPASKTDSRAAMVFDKTEYSFGVIVTGKVIEHEFSFVNKGSIPLVIYDASSTCGCTIPEYPKEPVMPGERSNIKVTYDSAGKIGTQDKPVTLKTNAGTYTLHLKGAVFTENMMKDDK